MRRGLRIGTPVAVIGMMALLCGCSTTGSTNSTCVDWVWFDTPDAAVAEADRVATGTVTGSSGTLQRYGEVANVWTVDVSEWVVGDGGDAIEVVSLPRTCEVGSPYPDGDPLDTEDEVMIFLRDGSDGVLETITGIQGVMPAPSSGGIPAEWSGPQ